MRAALLPAERGHVLKDTAQRLVWQQQQVAEVSGAARGSSPMFTM